MSSRASKGWHVIGKCADLVRQAGLGVFGVPSGHQPSMRDGRPQDVLRETRSLATSDTSWFRTEQGSTIVSKAGDDPVCRQREIECRSVSSCPTEDLTLSAG